MVLLTEFNSPERSYLETGGQKSCQLSLFITFFQYVKVNWDQNEALKTPFLTKIRLKNSKMEKQIPQLLFGVANPFDWRSSVVPVFLRVNHDAAEGLALCWKVAQHWCSGSCGRKQGLTAQCRWILHHLIGLIARIPHILAVDFFFFCHDFYFLSAVHVFLWAMWNIKCFMKCLAHAPLWYWFWKPSFQWCRIQ